MTKRVLLQHSMQEVSDSKAVFLASLYIFTYIYNLLAGKRIKSWLQ